MEKDLLHVIDQRLSHYKSHIGNPKKLHQPSISPTSIGLLRAPPPSLHRQQPPLLPLPVPHLRRSPKHHSFTLKKSTKSPKREQKKTPERSSDTAAVSSTMETKELSENILKVSRLTSRGNKGNSISDGSGSIRSVEGGIAESLVFTASPPPSSLPLPTFSLRRKLSCNARVDTGASDDLRRLLRLTKS